MRVINVTVTLQRSMKCVQDDHNFSALVTFQLTALQNFRTLDSRAEPASHAATDNFNLDTEFQHQHIELIGHKRPEKGCLRDGLEATPTVAPPQPCQS